MNNKFKISDELFLRVRASTYIHTMSSSEDISYRMIAGCSLISSNERITKDCPVISLDEDIDSENLKIISKTLGLVGNYQSEISRELLKQFKVWIENQENLHREFRWGDIKIEDEKLIMQCSNQKIEFLKQEIQND